ncbi:MAG TPA: MFS transporter [Streptosporangiaceae bacterium]|nr:MFS transporter [Streptosporangiaceae bacterium]
MTQVPAGLDAGQLEPFEPEPEDGQHSDGQHGAGQHGAGQHEADHRGLGGYRALLRTPGAARFCISGMIGRAPMSMFGLGTVLLVAASTGRYGLAGLVSGAGSIGYAACAPQIARLADRFGQHRVLRPLIAFFGIACVVFVTCAELKAPAWILMITGCLAGSSMPSLGSMVRARWSALLRDPAAIHAAFALESVIDEMTFVIGPALVTVLATAVPPAGVLVCMMLSVGGTLFFAAQRQTEPPVRPRSRESGADETGASSHSASQQGGASESEPASPRRRAGRLPAPGLLTMVPLYLFVGTMFASIDLSTVDFAQQHGHKPLAGFILGTYALGSAIGGLWYGSRHWRAPLERRFLLTLVLTVAGVATFWTQPSLISLDAGVLVAGLTISPTLIAGYGLIERQAPGTRRTEAMTWLSSSIAVGVAAGSSICGRIIDTAGPRWGYGFAATIGVIAVATCLLGRGRLRAYPDADTAQWVDA